MAVSYSESTSGTPGFYNQAYNDLLDYGRKLSTGIGGSYQGALTAGIQPMQQQAFDLTKANVGNYQPFLNQSQSALQGVQGMGQFNQGQLGQYLDPQMQQHLQNIQMAGMPATQQAMGMLGGSASFDPNELAKYMNPYTQNVVQEIGRLGNEQFQNVVNPTLSNTFQGLGQQGSARQAALLADAAAKSQREILGQQGQALNTGYAQSMQDYLNWAKNAQSAASTMGNLGQSAYQQALGAANYGTGAFQQGLQDYRGWEDLGSRIGLDTAGAYSGLGQVTQQLGLGDVGALMSGGNIQQQTKQNELTAKYNAWKEQQDRVQSQLGALKNLLPAAPSSNESWSASFKKGGLARYADGGRFPREEQDDLISSLISDNLSSSSSLPDLAQQAGQMRMSLAQNTAAQQVPERPLGERLGSAMLRASSQGPAHWGTLLGRAGTAFYGEEDARGSENRDREQEKRAMQERLTGLTGLGGGRALQGRQPTPEQLRTVYTAARNEAAQIAKDYQFPSAEARSAWIEQQAMATTENYLQNFATQPLGPRGGSLPMKGSELPGPSSAEAPSQPTRAPAQEQWPQAFNEPRVKFDSPSANLPSLNMRGTPESIRAELETLQEPDRAAALRALEASQAPAGSQEVPSPPLRDKRSEQYKQAYGGEEGKALFKERENLNTLFGTNASMVNQLNLLENLYSNPNLPEGELGPLLQKIRSGFQTFGVDVGDTTGPADLANAVAQKMVLAQRTSDGTNLLPGAVSNFEVQLLQSMGPTLSLTNEGRQALVRFMKEVALSNQRIAEEGSAFAAQNNEMLTPGWYKRKERVMLEEMARMKRLSDRIMVQFSNSEKGAR